MSTDFRPFGFDAIKVIGTGHFGSVYLVRKLHEPERMLVCKLVVLESLGDKDRRLAEQEVGLLRTLDHKNIVKCHDCFRVPSVDSLGLVMEYCDGGDLRHVIRQQSKLGQYFPEHQIMTWFVHIVDGLRYIHGQRVIHRDLKTSNLFLKGPPPYTCLIGDFGISRVLEESISAAHTVIGTPYYLSPEVCKKEPYTNKSDMWSLGACLYEMATLRMAFKAPNLLALVDKIIHDSFDPMDGSAHSPGLVHLVEQLLAKNPDNRPSAAELMRDQFVRGFITDKPELAPMTTTSPARPPSLRSRRAKPLLSIPSQIVEDPPDEVGLITAIHQIATTSEPTFSLSPTTLLPGRLLPTPENPRPPPPPPPKLT